MARMIGIVGGIGSYAGIDLIRKIYDQTMVRTDQDHLPVSMLSLPHLIQDRTEFILNKVKENPADKIGYVINVLAQGGAEVIGIPCNTAHVTSIFERILELCPVNCEVLHMIEEVGIYIRSNYPEVKRVGVLATSGTYISRIYSHILEKYDLEVLYPSQEIQRHFVHPAIYDQGYGIKAFSNPVKPEAVNDLIFASKYMIKLGAEIIVLGCTEIPLALNMPSIDERPLIDSTFILAKALIRKSLQEKQDVN